MSHPVMLLPWYLSGTLSEAERAEVAAHLETCAECRAELASLREMRAQLREAMTSDASPKPAARRRVLENVARSAPTLRAAAPSSVTGRLTASLRALFEVKWVPAAALALIAAQAGLLFWAMQRPPPAPQVTSRALAAPTARIRVTFVPSAREADIRTLLAEVRGRVVDGPSSQGEYVVEVLASDAARASFKLERLRARRDVVQQAEIVAP
jgi:anti-sigma factor RsiW